MKIQNVQNYPLTKKQIYPQSKNEIKYLPCECSQQLTFEGNNFGKIKGFFQYIKAQRYSNWLKNYLKSFPNIDNFPFRNLSMENFEGLQYGIKVFDGLSMKDIQYMCENLHVIAVKRGCTNKCGYCYADAKRSNREMSWEDFTSITRGLKKIRKRLNGLPLFGENMSKGEETLIYRTTELFYDADCINLAIKDKKGKLHDFRDLASELYSSLGRRTAFDTSGWAPENKRLQERAEAYAKYFSKPENMEKLNAFNLSFNVFNSTYICAVKALQAGNLERYTRLRDKFSDRIANAIFTFSPLLKSEKFLVLSRCFGANAKNAKHFDANTMINLSEDVKSKLAKLYTKDLNGEQKYVKSQSEIQELLSLVDYKLMRIETALNSSGRMNEFMNEFKIQAPMQNHTETTKILAEDLKQHGRFHDYLGQKLIDTDGKVYHMDYARFFPTEIQLNLRNKSATPELANLKKEHLISKEIINKTEERHSLSDFT